MVSDSVAQAVSASLVPRAFFAPPEAPLSFSFDPRLTWRWEILAGRLLDPALTREERTFTAWHVEQQVDDRREPRVSILLDQREQALHVVRHVEVRGFEAYESQPNVIESRPVRKWTRELIRSCSLAGPAAPTTGEQLTAWCAEGIYHALCGTSRLPIASHESQLPAFALGLIGYWPALAVSGEQGRAGQRTRIRRPANSPSSLRTNRSTTRVTSPHSRCKDNCRAANEPSSWKPPCARSPGNPGKKCWPIVPEP